MKPRILAFRFGATHDWITPLGSINAGIALTDYDAFVFDPATLILEAMNEESLRRRQGEISELIRRKGGLVICTLRPNSAVVVSGAAGATDRYSVLRGLDTALINFLASRVQLGEGSLITIVNSAKGASSGYYQVLKGNLRFEAYLRCSEDELNARSGKIFAVNSVGYPIAVEFPIGEGVLCFVPLAHNVPADRTGAAIVRVVRTHFEKQGDNEIPSWASGIEVPGAGNFDHAVALLKEQRERCDHEIAMLEQKREGLTSYLGLLYGYGKLVLERQVRASFRLFGFSVPEPEEYSGEWDVDITDSSGQTAIGEVEGSEGFVDVDKYRQLLDYVEAQTLEGKDRKGILIGNGFRHMPPEAPERQQQFSDHALRGAARNHFCLLPTTEIFKAVCAVLENPDNEILKNEIRDSILNHRGVWTFVRQATPTTNVDTADKLTHSASEIEVPD